MSEMILPRHYLSQQQHHGHNKSEQFDLFDEHMENYDIETSALHRKLQSKIEALSILRKELEQFRTERDQFKLMAETLQLRYSAIKRSSDYNNFGFGGKSSVANLLHETRERNLKLTTEVESLKQKLNELQGDIELLRSIGCRASEKVTERVSNAGNHNHTAYYKEEQQWKQERGNFICHLENLKKKNAQLAFDFKTVIDEKEEMITERDAYKCKAHRLNHELITALNGNKKHPKLLDIDSIVLENKYLHERLKNCENELDLSKQSVTKYKSMLESKRKKGIIKLGTSGSDDSALTHKQVKSILDNGIDLPASTETISDLKALCLALLDSLNDKNIALCHQKKTNKILATKIAELEQRVQTIAGIESIDSSGTCGYSPSQMLLQGYCPAAVDSSNNDTNDIQTITTGKSEDTGTMSSDINDCNKISRVISDDGMSSLSTESGRSVQSSEYGIELGAYSLSQLASSTLYAYKTPSTTTESGNDGIKNSNTCSMIIPSSIVKERIDDLSDLPPDLAAMVQKALHELDMRDFDEFVGDAEEIDAEVVHNGFATVKKLDTDEEQEEDDNTLN